MARKQSHHVMNLENILIKFTNEMKIDDFVKSYLSYTKKKKLIPASIGLSVNNGIFVSEYLSEDLSRYDHEGSYIDAEKRYTEEISRSPISCHGSTF